MHVCGNPVVSSRHVINKKPKPDVLGDTEAFTSAAQLLLCCNGNAQQRQSCAGSDGPFDMTFNRNFTVSSAAVSGLTGPDWAESRQLDAALVWTLVGR